MTVRFSRREFLATTSLLLGGLAALAGAGWAWREFGRDWWRRFRSTASGGKIDPVRAQAGRWLREEEIPTDMATPVARLSNGAVAAANSSRMRCTTRAASLPSAWGSNRTNSSPP